MSDLKTRLKHQLTVESDRLPRSSFGVDAAVRHGRRRRRRSMIVSSVGAVVVFAGLSLGVVKLNDSLGGSSETVFADQPESLDRESPPMDAESRRIDGESPPVGGSVPPVDGDGQAERLTLEVDRNPGSDPATAVEPTPDNATPTTAGSATSATATGSTPTNLPQPASGPSEADIARAAGARRSTAAAIGRLPSGSVLFSSDNEGCATIERGQAHPDWIAGQAGTGRNDDGTPTYGFAFNTGDSTTSGRTAPDIAWGFEESGLALSGRCVVSMTLNRADWHSDAIRLFRRYDGNGDPLPSRAYYSVWLYFPEDVVFDDQGTVLGEQAFGFWNVFQIKNDVAFSDGQRSMSAFSFNAGRLPDEDHMSLFAYSKVLCGETDDCREAHSIDQPEPVPIPIGRWVHFELHLDSRPDDGGRLQVWQDGRSILTYQGRTERPSTVRRTWSLTNMGHLHQSPNRTLLADDPVISTTAIHPQIFD